MNIESKLLNKAENLKEAHTKLVKAADASFMRALGNPKLQEELDKKAAEASLEFDKALEEARTAYDEFNKSN